MAKSCESIVLKEYVLSGPKGDQGEKGDPGETVAFPIAAVNISVTNAGYNNLQEVLDFLLYIPVNINSFTTPTLLFENRAVTDPTADFTIQFSWSINKDIDSQTLVGPTEMTPVALTPAERVKTVTMTNFNTNETFTLSVDDGDGNAGSTKSSNLNLEFTNQIYWGDSVIPASLDSDFVKTLTGNSLQKDNIIDVASNTVAGTYFYFVSPVDYGIPNILVGGFPLAVDTRVTIPFLNDRGYTEDYYITRAENDDLDAITLNIS